MAEAAPSAPLVDAHVHVFRADMPVAKGAWTRLDYEFTADQLIATLDAHGVRHAVVSGLSITGTYNDYVIATIRAHKRLRGTAILDPHTDLYTLEKMKADGIVGVRLQLRAWPTCRISDRTTGAGCWRGCAISTGMCMSRWKGRASRRFSTCCWKAVRRLSSTISAIPIRPIRLAARATKP